MVLAKDNLLENGTCFKKYSLFRGLWLVSYTFSINLTA